MLGVTCKFPCFVSNWNALLMSRSSSLIAGSINPWVSSYTSLHFLRIPWFTASLSIKTYPKEACLQNPRQKRPIMAYHQVGNFISRIFFLTLQHWDYDPYPVSLLVALTLLMLSLLEKKKSSIYTPFILGEIKEKWCFFFTWRPKKETVQSKSCNGNRLNDLRKSAVALFKHMAGLVPSINVKV